MSHPITPLTTVSNGISRLEHLRVEKRMDPDDSLNPKEVISRLISSLYNNHVLFVKTSSEWSGHIENGTQKVVEWLATPLTFCSLGKACQYHLSHQMGKLARAVSFVALQFLHFVPYLLASGVFSAMSYLFYHSPAALYTFFLGSLLIVQTLLIYKLIEGVRRTNMNIEISNNILARSAETFEKTQELVIEKVDKAFNVFEMSRKGAASAVNFAKSLYFPILPTAPYLSAQGIKHLAERVTIWGITNAALAIGGRAIYNTAFPY